MTDELPPRPSQETAQLIAFTTLLELLPLKTQIDVWRVLNCKLQNLEQYPGLFSECERCFLLDVRADMKSKGVNFSPDEQEKLRKQMRK